MATSNGRLHPDQTRTRQRSTFKSRHKRAPESTCGATKPRSHGAAEQRDHAATSSLPRLVTAQPALHLVVSCFVLFYSSNSFILLFFGFRLGDIETATLRHYSASVPRIIVLTPAFRRFSRHPTAPLQSCLIPILCCRHCVPRILWYLIHAWTRASQPFPGTR